MTNNNASNPLAVEQHTATIGGREPTAEERDALWQKLLEAVPDELLLAGYRVLVARVLSHVTPACAKVGNATPAIGVATNLAANLWDMVAALDRTFAPPAAGHGFTRGMVQARVDTAYNATVNAALAPSAVLGLSKPLQISALFAAAHTLLLGHPGPTIVPSRETTAALLAAAQEYVSRVNVIIDSTANGGKGTEQ